LVGNGLQVAICLPGVVTIAAIGFLAIVKTESMARAIAVVISPFGGFVTATLLRTIWHWDVSLFDELHGIENDLSM
jgi:hypothetical protein